MALNRAVSTRCVCVCAQLWNDGKVRVSLIQVMRAYLVLPSAASASRRWSRGLYFTTLAINVHLLARSRLWHCASFFENGNCVCLVPTAISLGHTLRIINMNVECRTRVIHWTAFIYLRFNRLILPYGSTSWLVLRQVFITITPIPIVHCCFTISN